MEKTINIRVLEHRKTGLLMAISDEMAGLVVHARSEDELERKLPNAVRDLLEADGFKVDDVTLKRDEVNGLADFGPPAFIASACLQAEAA